MKLGFPLSALTFFSLLAYLTHPLKREESPKTVEKQDFFKDFINGKTIAGSWINKDYIVEMQIDSIRLDMKLVFEMPENKDSTNGNRSPSYNRTPKHGKIHKFKEASRNATCHAYETVQPRLPGLMIRAWDFTVTAMTRAWNKCYDITVMMADEVWNGITWMAQWIWDKVTLLAGRVWNGVTRMTQGIWNRVTRMAEWLWNRLTLMAEWIWNGLTWLTEWVWNGLKSTGKLFIPGNYATDAAVKFYEYSYHPVTRIQARIVASTWQDVFYLISTVLALNFALLAVNLILKCIVHFLRRRWQARKDRIAAANSPPVPKKPIWRPKPKKKRRRNKNTW